MVSARKYRPESFGTLIGQDNIARTLSNSIRRGQLAHAYLFCGPRGVGKTTTARIFAKMINCSNPGPDMEPCGECESCISFREGRSYCIHEMDAASNNSVEDIKTLMEKVQVPPQVGRYSVYIIDEVHMLSQAAFNAFLKTLEEPPAHAIFILATTEKHKILPTILSRCQTYDFNRISVRDMVRNLSDIASKEGITVDERSLHVIAEKADGAMRDALTIFDQTVAFCGTDIQYDDVIRNLNVLDYKYSFSLTDNFLSGDYQAALMTFDEVLSKGFNALYFVSSLSSHIRNLVVSKTASIAALLDMPDALRQSYSEQAARCPLKFLYDALEITTSCESGYKSAVNPRLHIEFALMKLCFIVNAIPAAPAASLTPRGAVQGVDAPRNVNDAPTAPPSSDMVPAASKGVDAAETMPAAASAAASEASDEPSTPYKGSAGASDAAVQKAKESDAAVQQEKESAAAEQPAKAAPARRRAAKTGSALSMNALMDETPAEDETEQENAQEMLPSDELMQQKWKELSAAYASKPRLANMISSGKITVSEEGGVKILDFEVTNTSQKQWVEEKLLRELETRLRSALGCTKVNVVVSVTPESEMKSVEPYMPEQKAKVLIETNPDVNKFVQDLGLDVK